MSNFKEAKLGDSLYSLRLGWVEVVQSNPRLPFPLRVKDVDGFTQNYKYDGFCEGMPIQDLYWDKPEIIAPPKPKRKVTKIIERWANIYPDGTTCVWSTLADANAYSSSDRIVCVRLFGSYEVEE